MMPNYGQWHGGAVPPPVEGGATCQMQQWRLVGAPALGAVGTTCSTKRRGRSFGSLSNLWTLSGAAQSATAASTCTSATAGEGGHPQHSEAGQRSREEARGGGPGGFPLVSAGRAVTGPLDATYRGPYRVLIKERKKLLLEVGATRQWVSRPPEAAHSGIGPSCGAAASTWQAQQVLV